MLNSMSKYDSDETVRLGNGTYEERVPLNDIPRHNRNGPRNATNGPSQKNGSFSKNMTYPLSRESDKSAKSTILVSATIAASLLVLLLSLKILTSPIVIPPATIADDSDDDDFSIHKAIADRQLFDEFNRFIVGDYDAKPTFSDFLPGVAGIYGKPVWAFYVNRGQGIASFGTESKEFPIMQFASANHAYQNTAALGFRTFIQGYRSKGGKEFLIEPFSPTRTRYTGVSDDFSLLPERKMFVGANEVQIQEIDYVNRIETNVTYFILPEEDFGALVRRTTITNLDNKRPLTMSVLDGLARIEPAGGKLRESLEQMSNIIESFMNVYSAYNGTLHMPFYRLSMQPSDKADVQLQTHGHYCLSIIEGGDPASTLPIIYDTSKVFGEDTMLLRPVGLERSSVKQILSEKQYGAATTSSAFAAIDSITVEAGQSVTIASFYGKANDISRLPTIADKIKQTGYTFYKQKRAQELIKQITASVETKTGNHLFNGHVQQMFLDNSLRGGMPVILGDTDTTSILNVDQDTRLKVYHLFSRIHGDLERDYNDFVIEPTFFSQGPGNHRDVAQNRRNDVIFSPRIGSFNTRIFLSFIQADGYEPLQIEAIVFRIPDREVCDRLAEQAVGYAEGHRAQREALSDLLNSGPFRPGELFLLLEQQNIELILTPNNFINRVAAAADYIPKATYKSGYWADHWTYYMDFIDTYLSVYPDSEERILFLEQLPYFFSPASVRPRNRKYVLSRKYNGHGYHVRQLDATLQKDDEKENLKIQYMNNSTNWYEYDADANWQRDKEGNIFKSSVVVKLLLLGTIKFASRDAYGMGIEYEGGKPGWNDAMNGLPGMIGSGMPELFELDVLLKFLLNVVSKHFRRFPVPRELKTLCDAINRSLKTLLKRNEFEDLSMLNTTVPDYFFQYWNEVATARENYREEVRLGFSGKTATLTPEDLQWILKSWLLEIEKGKARAMAMGSLGDDDDGTSGIIPTYFSYNVKRWKETGNHNEDGRPLVVPLEMEVERFPLFLEGPVRMMKAVDREEAMTIYRKVRNSPLRDEKLNMYTISASLKGQNMDMGRMMAFPSGWLENQSVWLHMSYKFYLEMLRKEMFVEFFHEMQSGGILPFMNPDSYGRSLMECSSFIASSAFEDPARQGRGFLGRLSGSTAEFLSIWILMFIGPDVFYINGPTGELRMQLLPALPLWLFESDQGGDDNGQPLTISFKLFGMITVTYYNVVREDLYRVPPSRYVVGLRDGSTTDIYGPSIPQWLADKVRRVVFTDYISVYFE